MATAIGSPRARALSAALRKAREERGMSLRELARRVSMNYSHLSNLENGKRLPSVETTATILGALRVPGDERERILDLARNAAEPNWLTVGIPGIPQQLAGVVECERAASAITDWNPCVVPGLLQTTDYARAIALANASIDKLPSHEIESRLMVKVARREVLGGRNPVRFNAFIAEAALREPVGTHEVMAEQLRHLIKLSEQTNVTLQVAPQRVGWHPGLTGPFILFEFSDAPSVIYFEHYSSGAFVPDCDDVKSYKRAIENFHAIALRPRESIDLIARIVVDEWG
jgi:transcriptional regulator with XRE-family HTH domain